jgi:hypothetical protein
MRLRSRQALPADLLRAATLALAGVVLALPVTAGFVGLTAATLLGRSLVDGLRLGRRRRGPKLA